jgi:hypothetical protein
VEVEYDLFFARGSSFIPHFGQLPGVSITTSECIGQTYFPADDSASAGAFANNASAVIINKIVLFMGS